MCFHYGSTFVSLVLGSGIKQNQDFLDYIYLGGRKNVRNGNKLNTKELIGLRGQLLFQGGELLSLLCCDFE